MRKETPLYRRYAEDWTTDRLTITRVLRSVAEWPSPAHASIPPVGDKTFGSRSSDITYKMKKCACPT
ncbi:hypothetical protein AVEN_234722-1, partial [Araneus ventricosus]